MGEKVGRVKIIAKIEKIILAMNERGAAFFAQHWEKRSLHLQHADPLRFAHLISHESFFGEEIRRCQHLKASTRARDGWNQEVPIEPDQALRRQGIKLKFNPLADWSENPKELDPATIDEVIDVTALAMTAETFDRLLQTQPQLGAKLMRNIALHLSDRLRRATALRPSARRWNR